MKKVSINSTFISGPFGGGMQVARSLKSFFESKEVKVVNNLKDKDIDFVIHLNAFTFIKSKSAAYSFFAAYLYKIKHPHTIIIFQVNECDERKGTNYINKFLITATRYSDYVVYIASWLKPLLEGQGMPKNLPFSIILNGADEQIFNRIGKIFWDGHKKMKIVSHHWGGNYFKGHDIYVRLDKLLAQTKFAEQFEFTFIGNLPSGVKYGHSSVLKPLFGESMANELKKHDIYITASRNEPAGLHHIEAALCGLPILYINSGALPEYCRGFGVEFNENNFEEKLEQIRTDYHILVENLKKYSNTGTKMAAAYYDLCSDLYAKRDLYSLRFGALARLGLYVWYLIYGSAYNFFYYWESVLRRVKSWLFQFGQRDS